MEPRVRLVAYTERPYQIAVASARTCYAKDFVYVGGLGPRGERNRATLLDVLPDEAAPLNRISDPLTPAGVREEAMAALLSKHPQHQDALEAFFDAVQTRLQADDRIASSIYEAGHHTPFQHPTFVFALEDVSRNVTETVLHQHQYFNSEQQSQRYVEMAKREVYVPESIRANPKALTVFESAIESAWNGYEVLRAGLVHRNARTMTAIGRIKGQTDAQITSEAEKKSQEMARYVVPIAATTRLYHTVSAVVLLRYARMRHASGMGEEFGKIVDGMLAAVQAVDPGFLEKVREEPHPADQLLETDHLDAPPASLEAQPDGVELLRVTPDAEDLVRLALQDVTGRGDDALLQRVLDPGQNPLWNDTLNTWDLSPLLRCLRHVQLVYRKSISLTAYAQDQRHRTTPGTRPNLARLMTPQPNVVVPDVVEADDAMARAYDAAITACWAAMHELVALGIPRQDAAYLLPNATRMSYVQSGDLLGWIHKWRLRLCFNAQKEIFDVSVQELRQAQAVIPQLTGFIGPPCTFISAALPADVQDDPAHCCPEGDRWCGVKVWKNFDAAKGKPKRPF